MFWIKNKKNGLPLYTPVSLYKSVCVCGGGGGVGYSLHEHVCMMLFQNQVNFILAVLLITVCLDRVAVYGYFILASKVEHDNLVIKFLAK